MYKNNVYRSNVFIQILTCFYTFFYPSDNHYTYTLQVANSQLSLDIFVIEYNNPMNLEVRETSNGDMLYCCCDQDNTCEEDRSASSLQNCRNGCDTYLVAYLDDCDLSQMCFLSTVYEAAYSSNGKSSYGYVFTFNLDRVPQEVRKRTA